MHSTFNAAGSRKYAELLSHPAKTALNIKELECLLFEGMHGLSRQPGVSRDFPAIGDVIATWTTLKWIRFSSLKVSENESGPGPLVKGFVSFTFGLMPKWSLPSAFLSTFSYIKLHNGYGHETTDGQYFCTYNVELNLLDFPLILAEYEKIEAQEREKKARYQQWEILTEHLYHEMPDKRDCDAELLSVAAQLERLEQRKQELEDKLVYLKKKAGGIAMQKMNVHPVMDLGYSQLLG